MKTYIKTLLREELKGKITLNEQRIIDNLIKESINEGPGSTKLIGKLKGLARQGALTATIILGLLSNDALAQDVKQDVMNVAKTELSQDQKTELAQTLNQETGLEFDASSSFLNNFEKVDDSKPFAIPSGEQLKSQLIKGGIPANYVDNVYVDYDLTTNGSDVQGVKMNIRLKDETGARRLRDKGFQNKVMKKALSILSNYKPGGQNQFADGEGNAYMLSVGFEMPEGTPEAHGLARFKPDNSPKNEVSRVYKDKNSKTKDALSFKTKGDTKLT